MEGSAAASSSENTLVEYSYAVAVVHEGGGVDPIIGCVSMGRRNEIKRDRTSEEGRWGRRMDEAKWVGWGKHTGTYIRELVRQ